MKEQIKIYDLAEYPVTIIENAILESNLSAREKLILIALKRFAGRADRAWPGREAIGRLASCSAATVKRVLKKLEEKDLLRIIRREGKTSIYLLPGYRIRDGHLIAVWPENLEFSMQERCQIGGEKSGKSGDFRNSGKTKQKTTNFPELPDPGQNDPGGGSKGPGSRRPGSQRPPNNINIYTNMETYIEKEKHFYKNNISITDNSKKDAKEDVILKEDAFKEGSEDEKKQIKEEWERTFVVRFPFKHLDDRVIKAADYMLYLYGTGKMLRLRTPEGYLRKLTTVKIEPFPSYFARKRMAEEAEKRLERIKERLIREVEIRMQEEKSRPYGPRFC